MSKPTAAKKVKTHVITVSKIFPAYHPRKGQPTNFADKIYHLDKKHTIRGNYDWWKKRIDEVNSGEAILSVRQWIDKPYKKPGQTEIAVFGAGEVGIQQCDVFVEFPKPNNTILTIDVKDRIEPYKVSDIVKNDGLEMYDFITWFKQPIVNGCIIHFTDLRY